MLSEESVYSSISNGTMTVDPDKEQRNAVLKFLEDNKSKFYTAKEIAKATGLPTRGTQVEVRKAITKLLEIDMKPIMSNAKGFALVEQSNQMYFYARQLEERVQGIQRRIIKVRLIAGIMESD